MQPIYFNKQNQTVARQNDSDARTRTAEDILARTIYGEARGEGLKGMEAVASVILNRVQYARDKGGYWWGKTVPEVCQKKWQFSCWNKGDPNFPLITKVDASDKVFALCQRIARRAITGFLPDSTYGALHYHHINCNPVWASRAIPCAEIGHHLFYREIH